MIRNTLKLQSGLPRQNALYLKIIRQEVKNKTIKELERSVKRYAGEHLPDVKYREGSLVDEYGIPYIQSVCGSALSIIGQPGKIGGEKVQKKGKSILSHVMNNGNRVYSNREAFVVYAYLRIIKENRKINSNKKGNYEIYKSLQ